MDTPNAGDTNTTAHGAGPAAPRGVGPAAPRGVGPTAPRDLNQFQSAAGQAPWPGQANQAPPAGTAPMKVPETLSVGAGLVFCQLLVPGVYLLFMGAVALAIAGAGPGGVPIVLMCAWLAFGAFRYGPRLYRGSDQARWAAVGYLAIAPGIAAFGSVSIFKSVAVLSLVISAVGIRSLLARKSAAYCAGSRRPPVAALGSVLRLAGTAMIATSTLQMFVSGPSGYDRSDTTGIAIVGVIAGGLVLLASGPGAIANQLVMGAVALGVTVFAVAAVAVALTTSSVDTSFSAVAVLAAVAVGGMVAATYDLPKPTTRQAQF